MVERIIGVGRPPSPLSEGERDQYLTNENLWLVLLANLEHLTNEQIDQLLDAHFTHKTRGESSPISQLAKEVGLTLKRSRFLGLGEHSDFKLLSRCAFGYDDLEMSRRDAIETMHSFDRVNACSSEITLEGTESKTRSREYFVITPSGLEYAGVIVSLFQFKILGNPNQRVQV